MMRLELALAELAEAIREEIRDELASEARGPERLLSVDEAAAAAGIGRSSLYGLIGRGAVRSCLVGRRRLIPASAIGELARNEPAAEGHAPAAGLRSATRAPQPAR